MIQETFPYIAAASQATLTYRPISASLPSNISQANNVTSAIASNHIQNNNVTPAIVITPFSAANVSIPALIPTQIPALHNHENQLAFRTAEAILKHMKQPRVESDTIKPIIPILTPNNQRLFHAEQLTQRRQRLAVSINIDPLYDTQTDIFIYIFVFLMYMP